MAEQEEQHEIDAGMRVAAFLKDEAIIAAFARLDQRYWAQFKATQDAAEQARIGAKVSVIDDLKTELQITVDTGIVSTSTRERRNRR